MSDRWQQIEQIYHAALQREQNRRSAFLDEACAGDDALRREVQSLLDQEEPEKGFLEAPALAMAARMFADDEGRWLLGRQIGCYRVVSLLGVGGMGEVYRAHDSRLGRDVAVKVLPEGFADDPKRLARFEREARMLASLNHPNIATIYGLESSDGLQFLVMELVVGQTLAQRLNAGALPVEEALRIGSQIAEALEAAHDNGVIHRDLKPANVKVTPDGRVKVLDFGLAKALTRGSLNLSHPVALSEEGEMLGTAAYMSPEQARGKPVDKRTDIWAFGCVLYELLTGRPAFPGETSSDTIAAVLQREPEWQRLPPRVPLRIKDLLRRCLQKDPRCRLHDAADARIEIKEAAVSPGTAQPALPEEPARIRWRGTPLLVSTFLLLAAITGLVFWSLKPSSPPMSAPVSRVAITLPPGQLLAGLDTGSAIALSPDGTRLAYVARAAGIQKLYLRLLEGLENVPLPGTEGATQPFFSPDGQWVGFFADGQLRKVPLSGGQARSLGDAADPRGASWGGQGTIIFAPTRSSALWQVSDAEDTPRALTAFQNQDRSHRWPELLPDGTAILFAAGRGGRDWSNAQILAQRIASGEQRSVAQGGTYPRYASSGHLVYVKEGKLVAIPFDPGRLEAKGRPVTVVEGVMQGALSGAAQYAFSVNGTLVYVPANVSATPRDLVWVTRDGRERPLSASPHGYRQPRLSPDGRRIVVAIQEQETQVWIFDLARETMTRFSFEGKVNYNPLWTPDGKQIAFQSLDRSDPGLFLRAADGSGGMERVVGGCGNSSSWSADGKVLACTSVGDYPANKALMSIELLQLHEAQARVFQQVPFNEGAPVFSPDGHWLAYASDESGRYEIYVIAYPGPGGKYQISAGGGAEPVWNRNGRELFYRDRDKMMAVSITLRPRFSPGKPRMLFSGQYVSNPTMNANYDVSPDGQRFLMVKDALAESGNPTQVNVVFNWFEELKRRVPPRPK